MTTSTPIPAWAAWLQALGAPERMLDWSLSDWERIVRLARRLRLLARLAEGLSDAGLLDRVPTPPRRHLVAEMTLSHWRTRAMVWALERIGTTLQDTPYPLVLLKGGAYVGQDLPISSGRLPSDVDILVPRAHVGHAQAALVAAGWSEAELDEHDQRYYHEWSHEVPPMTHPRHAVELDLHHNILPPMARTSVDADLLLSMLRPSKWPRWQVLQPVDQVLHSAAHLFLDAEPKERIRDLVDLDGLMRHFGPAEQNFWPELPRRAAELGLSEPLALAAHFCTLWLGTPIPQQTRSAIDTLGPGALRRAWLLPLFHALLMPAEPDEREPWSQKLAAQIVLARYHRQRLPLRLLVPHLWHKLKSRHFASDPADAAAARG